MRQEGGTRHLSMPEDKQLPENTPCAPLLGDTWNLGDLTVTRFGYGAMQLAGLWVIGPPADHDGCTGRTKDLPINKHVF